MRKLALPEEILLSIDKPARYIGNETNMVKKDKNAVDIRFCMCFPDVYEIGMSHLGIQILYDMFNQREDIYCERVYSPWFDLDKLMREKDIPLFALESQDPVRDFDFLGITLQYEMCYTNVLQILELSKIEIFAKDRGEDEPVVIGGGPCAYNPEPIADFFDIFYIGEGETVYFDLMDLYKKNKESGGGRKDFLLKASNIEGIYVPSLYETSYKPDGSIAGFTTIKSGVPEKVKKQVEIKLSETYYPEKPLVPFIKVTQDRVVLEIQRGCIRGCRFCQAGMIYRPIRERSLDFLKDKAKKMIKSTGYEEISLSSLSSSDYSHLKELVDFLIEEFKEEGVNISLPSLRIDAFSLDVMSRVQDIRKSSITFAPEAGSQRLRNVINKGLSEEDIINGASQAFLAGWNKVKLYFMLGLPTENNEDIEGIARLSDLIARQYYDIVPKEKRQGKVSITTSTSFFVPKPFTAFQWAAMSTKEEFEDKQHFLSEKLKEQLNKKSIKYNWHEFDLSILEGVLARGDRRLSGVIYDAYKSGSIFDSWSDGFDNKKWQEAFEKNNIDPDFYAHREREYDEILPWDFIDAGINRRFLWNEYEKAKKEETSPNCRVKCMGCGAKSFKGGICHEAEN